MSELTSQRPAAESATGEWQAIHIFYAANPQPVLIECIRPLVAGLTADGLLDGYFFINYWLEGPHIRLRLKPATADSTPEVRRRAERAIGDFLSSRPALYDVDPSVLGEFYKTLLDTEFPDSDRQGYVGADGNMTMRQNNSFSYEPYEPEYGKYGGPAGIELAEWHFRHSSDLAIDAFGTMNLHLRTVLLGTSGQLMMVMAASFLPEAEDIADHLDSYYEFWRRSFPGTGYIEDRDFSRNYAEMSGALSRRFGAIREAVASGEPGRLPAFLRGWAAHCTELRQRAEKLAVSGDLVFQSWDGTQEERVTDPALALPRLLSPYMHMTNNRMHVTISDEAYLANVLGQALRDSTGEVADR